MYKGLHYIGLNHAPVDHVGQEISYNGYTINKNQDGVCYAMDTDMVRNGVTLCKIVVINI